MARMYPSHLDPETKSGAERILYHAFREQLDDSYLVFHQVHWLALDKQKRPRDGEADFVIIHPERGIIVLEVKGGGIRRDFRLRQWTTISATGEEYTIKNPVEQAKESKFVLLDYLKLRIKHYVNLGHAVAFPDVIVGETLLGVDIPRAIVLDATDIERISDWVGCVLQYWRGSRAEADTAPGLEGTKALISLFGKQWELRPALWGQFTAERQQLIHLTQEQYTVLDGLNRHRRMVISGFAGSGKTMLAAEKATRLARQGFRVLLTCYNRNLAQDLRERLNWVGAFDLYNFHDLCLRLVREAGLPVLTGTESNADFYERILPNALLKASDILHRRYDAIIIDEGQDFLETWWSPLLHLLHDPERGIVYIFFDENQRIYSHPAAFPFTTPLYVLTINCRTTKYIHEQVLKFYHAEERPLAKGPVGRPVELSMYQQKQSLQEALLALVQRLTTEEQIPSSEIMILTPFSHKKSLLKPVNLPHGSGISWSNFADHAHIETIYSAKGLERSVIILVELERRLTQGISAKDREKLLYVACSRACHHLIILLPKSTPEIVRRYFDYEKGNDIQELDEEKIKQL